MPLNFGISSKLKNNTKIINNSGRIPNSSLDCKPINNDIEPCSMGDVLDV
jgi:hypothetical protein